MREEAIREADRTGDRDRLKDIVTTDQIKEKAKKYAFQGFVECSAKEKIGLNDVFKNAFKVVF